MVKKCGKLLRLRSTKTFETVLEGRIPNLFDYLCTSLYKRAPWSRRVECNHLHSLEAAMNDMNQRDHLTETGLLKSEAASSTK